MREPIVIKTRPMVIEFVPGGGVVQGRHERRVDRGDRERDEEREPDQRVGGHPAHRGEAANLARELLALAHRLGNHVEQAGERAPDLALDRHRGDDEREVLRADAFGHVTECVVHRLSELRLGQHALELLRSRLGTLLDSRLDALAERVARLQRRRDRDQQIGQLVLEPPEASGSLQTDVEERGREAHGHPDECREGRRGGNRDHDAEEERRAGADRDQLTRAEREVGALDHRLHGAELLEIREDSFDPVDELRASRLSCLSSAILAHFTHHAEVRLEARLHPRALARRKPEAGREEDQEAREKTDRNGPCRAVAGTWDQARRAVSGRRIVRAGERDRPRRGARAGNDRVQVQRVAGPRSRVVGHLPGSSELVLERAVDRRKLACTRCLPIRSTRLGRNLAQLVRGERRAADSDRVDGGARELSGSDRLTERVEARDVFAVGDHDDRSAGTAAVAELVGGIGDRVVQRCPALRVDRDVRQSREGVARAPLAVRQRERRTAEDDDSDGVVRTGRRDEGLRRADGVRQRAPSHRFRAVDGQLDRLRLAEIRRREPDRATAVLAQMDGGRSSRCENRRADDGEAAGVDRGDANRTATARSGGRGGQQAGRKNGQQTDARRSHS